MNDESKRASWLELFYDVAYIALIAQLTYLAADHHSSLTDILIIGIIGYAIFIAWWATTANRNLLPVETKSDKLITQLQMLGAFLMSLSMPAVFEGNPMPLFLSLGFVRIIQTMMLVKLYYFYPDTRPVTYNILQGFIIAAVLWVTTAFVPDPYFIIVALSALAIDVLIPLTVGKGNTIRYLNVHHLQERLGLFLMLVIGESMIVVALANTAPLFSMSHPTIVFSGLGLMVALWWIYFEHSDLHAGQRPKNLFLFLHAHGFLYGSIILVSVAYKLIIKGGQDDSGMIFLPLGAFGIFASILTIRSTLHKICTRSVVLISGLALVAVSIVLFGLMTGRVYETAVLITLLFAVVAKLDHHALFGKSKEVVSTN